MPPRQFLAFFLLINCRQWNKKTTEDQAKKTYDRALKLEEEFGIYFTGMYRNNYQTYYIVQYIEQPKQAHSKQITNILMYFIISKGPSYLLPYLQKLPS